MGSDGHNSALHYKFFLICRNNKSFVRRLTRKTSRLSRPSGFTQWREWGSHLSIPGIIIRKSCWQPNCSLTDRVKNTDVCKAQTDQLIKQKRQLTKDQYSSFPESCEGEESRHLAPEEGEEAVRREIIVLEKWKT